MISTKARKLSASFFHAALSGKNALKKLVEQSPSEISKDYGKPFLQIFREADRDFYKIDHGLFAPAVLMINNAKTGRTFKAGQINPKVLAESLGF